MSLTAKKCCVFNVKFGSNWRIINTRITQEQPSSNHLSNVHKQLTTFDFVNLITNKALQYTNYPMIYDGNLPHQLPYDEQVEITLKVLTC